MRGVLQHLSSFYTRYFGSTDGEQSAQWLHRQLAEVCFPSPRRESRTDKTAFPLDHQEGAFPHAHLTGVLHTPLPPAIADRAL